MTGTVRPRVAGSYRLGHEVGLLPSRLPVDVPQLLVLPHGEEDLAGELDHPGAVLGPLPRHVHQPVHATGLQQRPGWQVGNISELQTIHQFSQSRRR